MAAMRRCRWPNFFRGVVLRALLGATIKVIVIVVVVVSTLVVSIIIIILAQICFLRERVTTMVLMAVMIVAVEVTILLDECIVDSGGGGEEFGRSKLSVFDIVEFSGGSNSGLRILFSWGCENTIAIKVCLSTCDYW